MNTQELMVLKPSSLFQLLIYEVFLKLKTTYRIFCFEVLRDPAMLTQRMSKRMQVDCQLCRFFLWILSIATTCFLDN